MRPSSDITLVYYLSPLHIFISSPLSSLPAALQPPRQACVALGDLHWLLTLLGIPSPDLQGDFFESLFKSHFLSLPVSLQLLLFSGILILLTLFFLFFFSLLSPSSLKYYLIYLFVIFIIYSVYPQTDFNVSSRRKRILEFCSLMNWKGLALGWSHGRCSINICGMNADRTEFKGSKKVEKMQS